MIGTTFAGVVLGVHLHTFHLDRDRDTPVALRANDSTPGLFVRAPEYPVLGGEPTAGLLPRNSFGRPTFYGGLTWQTESKRAALSLALASGYQYRRVIGPQACAPGIELKPGEWCWWDHGKTSAKLLPIGALSVAFPETKPYLLGGTARVLWIGKGVSLAVEWGGR